MRVPGKDDARKSSDFFVAAEDVGSLAENAVPLINRAVGIDWYHEFGTDVDRATLNLCRLRRARAGQQGGPEHGDEAVRQVLADATPEAIIWITSRAISYMDETGFPEAVEPWFATADDD